MVPALLGNAAEPHTQNKADAYCLTALQETLREAAVLTYAVSSCFATAALPVHAARCSGVDPAGHFRQSVLSSRELSMGLAPALSSTASDSCVPACAAKCAAVRPACVRTSTYLQAPQCAAAPSAACQAQTDTHAIC
eukprot:GHRQ01031958.1.p2 GENE.GHRQ01031958.1~~GHRQ01031958.1.p2  ORF type:complete len:137 (-),score=25.86 GHRQ01031958.1:458-868(-)